MKRYLLLLVVCFTGCTTTVNYYITPESVKPAPARKVVLPLSYPATRSGLMPDLPFPPQPGTNHPIILPPLPFPSVPGLPNPASSGNNRPRDLEIHR